MTRTTLGSKNGKRTSLLVSDNIRSSSPRFRSRKNDPNRIAVLAATHRIHHDDPHALGRRPYPTQQLIGSQIPIAISVVMDKVRLSLSMPPNIAYGPRCGSVLRPIVPFPNPQWRVGNESWPVDTSGKVHGWFS